MAAGRVMLGEKVAAEMYADRGAVTTATEHRPVRIEEVAR